MQVNKRIRISLTHTSWILEGIARMKPNKWYNLEHCGKILGATDNKYDFCGGNILRVKEKVYA